MRTGTIGPKARVFVHIESLNFLSIDVMSVNLSKMMTKDEVDVVEQRDTVHRCEDGGFERYIGEKMFNFVSQSVD